MTDNQFLLKQYHGHFEASSQEEHFGKKTWSLMFLWHVCILKNNYLPVSIAGINTNTNCSCCRYGSRRVANVSFLLQSFALLLSNLCILSVQLDLSAVGKIDKTNLPGFNSLKNAHILPWGNSHIPSWDSWIVECDMFTPPAILYYSRSQSASNIYAATVDRATWSFCP